MPSRDHDLSHDDPRPEGRWGEPPREPARREPERRYGRGFEGREGRGTETDGAPETPGDTYTHQDLRGGSAFTAAAREPRPATGPGSSYGSTSGGRASGSQAYGHAQHNAPRDGQDLADHSEPGYDRSEARRRAEGDWTRAPQPAQRPPGAEPGRAPGWPGEPAPPHRAQVRPGWERPDDTLFDADYRQWREEQMRMLDREYAQWRQERYRRFAEEFSQWRSQRLQAQATTRGERSERPAAPADDGPALGNTSALGPVASSPTPLRSEERTHEPGRERPGGGLLSNLLGSHERHKPKA